MTDNELIEAVAIEVMGFELTIIESNEPYPDSFCYRKTIERVWWNKQINCPVKRFNPLTDMNHMMMVVERMVENSFMCDLTIWPDIMFDDNEDKDSWRVIFSKEKIWYKQNKSIGHAICLAALEAVRQGKDD